MKRYAGLAVLLACCCEIHGADTADSIASTAVTKIEAGDYQGAATLLRPLLAKTTDRADLWNLLGVCESELDHAGQARAAFEKGLSIDPSSVPLNENLGNLLFRQHDYAGAKLVLRNAIALGSASPGVAFSLAASRLRTGEAEQGLALLRALEKPLTNQPDYWTERGWAEVIGDLASASISFDRALALAPSDVRALNGAATVAEAQNDDEKAISFLLRATKADPKDVRSLLHFADLCLRRDLTIDARQAVEQARKLAPANDLALFLDARVQIGFQQWQLAHDLFTEFDKRVPNYAPAQYALGWIDTKLNKATEARAHFENSIALDPSNADVHFELAQLDWNDGKTASAEQQLRLALDHSPNHAKAQVAMGDLLARKGDLAGARSAYESAIAADPKSGPAHYKLSTVLMRLGDASRAEQERTIGADLNAQATKAAKTVLVLTDPEGRLLSGVKTRWDAQ